MLRAGSGAAVRLTVTGVRCQLPVGLAAAVMVGGAIGAWAAWRSGAKAPVTSRQVIPAAFRTSTPTRQPRFDAARLMTAPGAGAGFSTTVGRPLPSR